MPEISDNQDDASSSENGDPQPSQRNPRRWLWAAAQLAHVLTAITQVALFIASTHTHL
jgi:hypothetical protein